MTFLDVWFSFRGKIDRKTYWLKGILPLFGLFGAVLVGGYLLGALGPQLDGPLGTFGYIEVLTLSGIYPALAIYTKRWHDIGKSGWWSLLFLVPIVGFITFIYLGVKDSTVDQPQAVLE
ncbi:MAG: DUF805 domain-containing protein [Chloroflexi bacterium]|nr:DUF805 domain-containing protein [Chloroflexota bacterium]